MTTTSSSAALLALAAAAAQGDESDGEQTGSPIATGLGVAPSLPSSSGRGGEGGGGGGEKVKTPCARCSPGIRKDPIKVIRTSCNTHTHMHAYTHTHITFPSFQ